MKGLTFAAATAALTISISVASGASQRPVGCRDGTGDLGIARYNCDGGACTVSEQLPDGRVVHRFSVEPRITNIDPHGPGSNKLKNNDVLVAIDGFLVTTLQGGYKLANASIGVPVKLRLRRDKKEIEVEIVPVKGCNLPSLSVVD